LPFLFNALKINSTLALIGAIVAEFFGSPIVRHGVPHQRPRLRA
jgi:ABC-type nitrate/sulfonate/bicarbonate transport system permease component